MAALLLFLHTSAEDSQDIPRASMRFRFSHFFQVRLLVNSRVEFEFLIGQNPTSMGLSLARAGA
jgi:hypothetical protein